MLLKASVRLRDLRLYEHDLAINSGVRNPVRITGNIHGRQEQERTQTTGSELAPHKGSSIEKITRREGGGLPDRILPEQYVEQDALPEKNLQDNRTIQKSWCYTHEFSRSAEQRSRKEERERVSTLTCFVC